MFGKGDLMEEDEIIITFKSGFLFICRQDVGDSCICDYHVRDPNGLTYEDTIQNFLQTMLEHLLEECDTKEEAFKIIDQGVEQFRARLFEVYKIK